MFTQMVLNNKKDLDLQLLFDVVRFADASLAGRLLTLGKLTLKDVNNCWKLVEIVAKLLLIDRTKDLAYRNEQ